MIETSPILLLSKCCNAELKIHNDEEGTSFYYCSECGDGCDPSTPRCPCQCHCEKKCGDQCKHTPEPCNHCLTKMEITKCVHEIEGLGEHRRCRICHEDLGDFKHIPKKQAKIACAAILDKDGKLWLGKRHSDAIWLMSRFGKSLGKDTSQGFVNILGTFLTRREAAKVAYECGQIKDPIEVLHSYDLELYSEDLY